MAGETDLDRLLASLDASRRPGTYVYVTLPRAAGDVEAAATVVEDEGVTHVVAREVADGHGWPYEGAFAWITLRVHSSLTAVGLTAAFSQALGAAGIPCNVLAGHHHDHVLVPVHLADEALGALRRLQEHAAG